MRRPLLVFGLVWMVLSGTNLYASTQSGDMLTDRESPPPSIPDRSLPLFSATAGSDGNASTTNKDMLHPLQPVPENAPQDMVNPTLHHQPDDRLYNWPQGGSLHP